MQAALGDDPSTGGFSAASHVYGYRRAPSKTVGGKFGDDLQETQFAAFTLLGLGFYTLHASIQVQATELSTTARGAAMSLHSFFFFIGHASGPVLYGAGFVKLGSAVTISIAAIIVMAVGFICARLLR